MGKLKASQIKSLPDGFHADGNGLYLSVSGNGKYRSWVYRCKVNGVQKKRGLGSVKNISLTEARNMIARGKLLAKSTKLPKFQDISEQIFKEVANIKRWKQDDTAKSNWFLIEKRANPLIGDLKVDQITPMILSEKFMPFYNEHTSRALALFSLLNAMFAQMIAKGWLTVNPVINMRGLLPARNKVHKTEHLGAVPWVEMPLLLSAILERRGKGYKTQIILAALTACRLNEILELTWDEVDLTNNLITLLPERTKTAITHVVPLSTQVQTILRSLPQQKGYVFDYRDRSSAISFFHRVAGKDKTIHGFRSSFMDWCMDNNKPWLASEKALGHSVGNQVTRAYLRTDAMEERRLLMQEWADFCCQEVSEWLEQLPVFQPEL